MSTQHGCVLNSCYGGFEISDEAREYLEDRGLYFPLDTDNLEFRCNPILVKAVQEKPDLFNGDCCNLRIIYFSKDEYESGSLSISDYDGRESLEVNKEKLMLFQLSQTQNATFIKLLEAITRDFSKEEIRKLLKDHQSTLLLPIKPKPFPPT